MMHRTARAAIVPSVGLTTILMHPATAAANQEFPEHAVLIEPGRAFQPITGFGAQIWVDDASPLEIDRVIRELDLDVVRLAVGPDWHRVGAEPPENASPEQMFEYIRSNFDGDIPGRRANTESTRDRLATLGVRTIVTQFGAPRFWEQDGRQLRPDRLEDFANFWAGLCLFLDSIDFRPDQIELTNEPDGDWNTFIPPDSYARLAVLTRRALDASGLEDIGILGPGLAFLSNDRSGPLWLEALEGQPAASLAGISTHAWDEKIDPDRPVENLIETWDDFMRAANRHTPGLPVIVTEYGVASETIAGKVFTDNEDRRLPTVAADSPEHAVQAVANTIIAINAGASDLIFWQLADQPWEDMAWGLLKREDDESVSERTMLDAFRTVFPLVPNDAVRVYTEPDEMPPTTQVTALRSGNRLVLLAANTGSAPTSLGLAIDDPRDPHLVEQRVYAGRDDSPSLVTKMGAATIVSLPGVSTITLVFELWD